MINARLRCFTPLALAAAIACAALVTEAAQAEPSPQDRALAKADWTKGKQQMAVKAFDAAAELFASADARDPKAQYKLDLARADIELGKWVEAAELLEEIDGLQEANAEREKAAAKSTLEKLLPRIPVVKFVVEGCTASDLTASIAGEDVALGAPVRRNPGRYTVSMHSEHCAADDKTFSLAEGETYDLKVAFTQTDATPAKKDDEEPKRTGGTMAPAAVAFAVGGASLVVGAIFGGLAYDLTSQLAQVCKKNVCPSSYLPVLETTLAYGNTSTATIVIGGVGVALGVVLAVTVGRGSAAPDAKDEKKEAAFVAPYFTWQDGPTGVKSVGLAGAF